MNRTSVDERLNLLLDFYTMATQGICLGVEALAWHGYGFDSTCDRGQTPRVLNATAANIRHECRFRGETRALLP